MIKTSILKRPQGLKRVEWNIEFNNNHFEALEIDLEHVNKGKQKTRQTYYDEKDVLFIFDKLVNNSLLHPVDKRKFKNEICEYFIISGPIDNIKFKLIFCICSDRPKTIGVITLHRVKK